jgi:hypothetical protein
MRDRNPAESEGIMRYDSLTEEELLDVIHLAMRTETGSRLIDEARKESEDSADPCAVMRDEMAGEYVRRRIVGVGKSQVLAEIDRLSAFKTVRALYGEMATSGELTAAEMETILERHAERSGEWFFKRIAGVIARP